MKFYKRITNMLKRTTSSSRRLFLRHASSKSRAADSSKISVQLLKDFSGLGVRGEIVNVSPGQMRNQLHRQNGAAYVLKGEPLRIPVRTRESVLQEQSEKAAQKAQAEAEKAAQAAVQEGSAQTRPLTDALEKLTNLKFNIRKEEQKPQSTVQTKEDEYILESSLAVLPPLLTFRKEAKISGVLQSYLTAQEFADHISELTGATVSADRIAFQVLVDHNTFVDSSVLDFIGRYNVTIQISDSRDVLRKIQIVPSNEIPSGLKRPFGPIGDKEQKEVLNPSETLNTRSSGAEKTAEEQGPSKFSWENEFITKLEQKISKK